MPTSESRESSMPPMKPHAPVSVRYSIDSQDRIFQVNEDWLRFAAENEGGLAEPAEVIGKSLWACIEDETLSELYREMVGIARLGKCVRFNYRCDAPDFRRLFEMQIQAREDLVVDFTSTLLEEQKRANVAIFECRQPRNTDFVKVCSWCKRVAVGGRWLTVEAAVEKLGILDQPTLPALTHGICDDCHARMLGKLAALRGGA